MEMRRKITVAFVSVLLLVTNLGAKTVLAENEETGIEETEETTEEITEENSEEQSDEITVEESEETAEAEQSEEEIVQEEQELAVKTVEKYAEIENVNISATYDSDAFDEDVSLKISYISEDSAEYKKIEESLENLADSDDGFSCDGFVAFDIEFLNAENTVLNPKKEINIKMTLDESVLEAADMADTDLIHINEEGKAEIIEDVTINADITSVSFTNDEFSPYVLVRNTPLLSAAGPEKEGWNDDLTMFAEIIENEDGSVTYQWVKNTFRDVEFLIDEETGETETFTFYFDAEGKIVTDKTDYLIEDKYYCFDSEGHVLKNIWSEDGQKYYCADGSRYTGQHKIDGFYYYFDETTGIKITGLKEIPSQNKIVFYNDNGQMHYGQKKLDGYWYFFDLRTGGMLKNKFQYIENNDKTCYYDANGHMVYGQRKIDGYWYYFTEGTGAMVKGLKYIESQKKTVYYNAQGRMQYGQQKVNGDWYYFKEGTGAMIKGWVWIESQKKSVYYQSDGKMAHGTVSINGIKHKFDSVTGKGTPEVSWVKKNVGGYRPWYIKVNTATNVTTVYTRDYNGEFNIPVKAFICTTGKKSKPTPAGISYTSVKYRWYYNPIYDLWNQYCTFFGKGTVMFHSLAYESQNRYDLRVSQWDNIGKSKSSGCVRMYVRDTKWIYDNIPEGVTVKTFKGTSNDDRLGKPAKLGPLISGLRWDLTDVK